MSSARHFEGPLVLTLFRSLRWRQLAFGEGKIALSANGDYEVFY